MLQMGLPLSFDEGACPAVLLHPETARALSDEELKALLHRSVMTSGETLSILAERGLSAALPVRAEPETTHELSCRLTGHPFNRGHQGETWSYCDFHGQDRTYILVSEAPDAEVLEQYVHEGSGQEAGAASVKFRTAAGGEWVVFGSHFWDCNIGTGKRQQILLAADALSAGRLPALLRTAAQVLLIPRVDADGMLKNLTLLNLSLDETGPLKLLLRCPAETLELVGASRAEVLRPVPDGEGRCIAWVSSLSPWEAATIFVP